MRFELFRYKNKDFSNYINALVKSKKDFKIKQSNSSIVVEVDGKSRAFTTENKNMHNVFRVVKKIKKYIQENDIKFYQDKNDCVYTQENQNFAKWEKTKMYAIDLSMCYITIALKIGMISEELYNECSNLEKEERLIVMGMLAYNPTVFVYKQGIEVDCYRQNNRDKNKDYEEKEDYSQNFFRLVRETDIILGQIAKKLGSDFCFFWVDCVVFKHEHNVTVVTRFFESLGFRFKSERVFEMEIQKEAYFTKYFLKKFSSKKRKLSTKEYTFSPYSSFEKKIRSDVFKALKNGDMKSVEKIFFEKRNTY